MMLYLRPQVVRSLLILILLFSPIASAKAENVAPGPHWGSIAYPDRDRTLMAGFTTNRFTEFDAGRNRFNAINQTSGFNFATFTWTDRFKSLPGWSGNLTFGAGPTSAAPSRNLQSFFHHATTQGMVPIDQARGGADFMVGGSMTRWSKLFSSRDTGFAGGGFVGGSLYQEAYGRIGVRHLSLAELADWMLPGTGQGFLQNISQYVRFSAMGRYSRIFGGSAYPSDVTTNQSYLGQVSMSFADFGSGDGPAPRWQLEVSLTYDSGLFARTNTHMILRRFGSIALHFPYGTFEVWDDWAGSTDSGPTYGYSLMLNLLAL